MNTRWRWSALAFVLLALTGGGSAVAARLITSKDIKNGTIQLVDISGSARSGLAGARGPQGAPGAAGAPGPAGPAGSNAVLASPEPWQSLPLVNSWTAYGGGYEEPAFRRDQLGRVHLRGLARRTIPPVQGVVIATLPPGYRPPQRLIFTVFAGADGATPGEAAGRVDVDSNGAILWWVGPSTAINNYTSLTGISFWTDG